MTTKLCSRCVTSKPDDAFSPGSYMCKPCRAEYVQFRKLDKIQAAQEARESSIFNELMSHWKIPA